MNKLLYSMMLSAFALAACDDTGSDYTKSDLDSTALEAITEEGFKNYISTLASDDFMGRKPFTKGDTLTVEYIKAQFENLELTPGNEGSFFQEVPMVEILSTPVNPQLEFVGSKGNLTVDFLDDYVIGSKKLKDNITVNDSELIFVGFGIVAPEFDWNDYEGLDVTGKTVVAMVSDPGHYDNDLFKADTMTYYGRWNYKYEEAARQGAAGIILIHDTKPASYGWNVVRNGWTGPQLDLIPDDNGESYADFEGWVTNEVAKKLFEIGGLDYSLTEEAKKPGFKAIPLNVKTSVSINNTFRKSKSNNVIAKIEGSKRPDEVIIYTAHWDHLGIGEPINGDSIFNGAIDNAAGVSALFEIAKAFKATKVKPERTIVFLAVTAEEEGLLGSKYYSEHPIYPINKTVANLNMDAFDPVGPTKDVSIVGIGQSELEDYVENSAHKFGRTVRGESNPTTGGFYRSDHFNFVKKGIPGLFMGSGDQYTNMDEETLAEKKKAFEGRYHNVTDELDDHWNFEGIVNDARLFFDIGYTLSMEKTFPKFKEKSEFREIGEKRFSK